MVLRAGLGDVDRRILGMQRGENQEQQERQNGDTFCNHGSILSESVGPVEELRRVDQMRRLRQARGCSSPALPMITVRPVPLLRCCWPF